ncbi:head GIN domain-containing protein [Constantimarinum furrinae]|uniref:Putative auto-transporter adhesin head GIN domain-containing protein n=1 Tax=Constantimarinum furrinae TaxID=2562285 RepID=A0A7G8PRK6_9FLAO|nr:head GIN domain-containing protein [Constantimarinum furrinae]QNJ96972.1 hypothetical protein ALE3EI_0385 [Constantimarinum furrinae]
MKIKYILLVLLSVSCSADRLDTCFRSAGNTIQIFEEISDFSRIQIEGEVSLTVKQGPVHEVLITTGENLMEEISVTKEGDLLIIRDANYCNIAREYGVTHATVTTPTLTEIRNSSSYDVVGEGVLNFDVLRLISNTTGNIEEVQKSGDFRLIINTEHLNVSANGQSIFYISGSTESATLSFTDELPRFEGSALIINELTIFQRSANKMIVNPQHRISGKIYGTGDVISLSRPPIIDVEEFFTGRLIFQD